MTIDAKKPFELTGRHVISGFVAFFAVLIAVQAAFVTIAISTHTGLVSKQPYRKGLMYAERIEQARLQEKLGWRETVRVSNIKRTLSVAITDQYGQPVQGLNLGGSIGRGVTDAQDSTLAFKTAAAGLYIASLPEGMAGTYIADIAATRAGDDDAIVWRLRKRLWLQP